VVFPGDPFGSPYHFLLWTKGNTALTSRLFSPVRVDACTGALTTVVRMPWYLRALEVSRPLHFGDYGGLPLKLIWGGARSDHDRGAGERDLSVGNAANATAGSLPSTTAFQPSSRDDQIRYDPHQGLGTLRNSAGDDVVDDVFIGDVRGVLFQQSDVASTRVFDVEPVSCR